MSAPGAKKRGQAARLHVLAPEGGRRSGGGRSAQVAPSLVSLPVGAHNLPRELTTFVGRQPELRHLHELMESSPLVTVTGPSGMGKTRLVVHASGQRLESYPDGVWLVELGNVAPTRDPAAVVAAVGAVLDVRDEPGRSRTEAVAARLRSSTALLILDNCEHVVEATGAVATELLDACPRLSIVATSQQPLRVAGEQVCPLGPLTLPGPGQSGAASDAVALFHARAKAASPNFVVTPEGAIAVTEICARLDGIPLAIELAAARTAVLSPTEIAEHLDERFSLLARTGSARTTRHQTLQSALDWSYDLLPPPEKALLRRLSVFVGGASLREVREVCTGDLGITGRKRVDVPAEGVVDLLASLVSKSLVVADTTRARARYRLLETIRAYARQQLERCGESEVVEERHAEWFVGFAERGWHQVVVADQKGGAESLEIEHDNLRAALSWLLNHDRGAVALRVGAALTPFWKTRGHFRDGREWLERALEVGGDAAPPALRARALWGVGLLAMMQGDLDPATAALEQSLEVARAHGHDRPAMEALNLLAFIAVFARDPVTALPLLEEAVALARTQSDQSSLVTCLALYGRAHLFSGDTASAQRVFEECLERGRVTGDGSDTEGLIGLGWVALSRGDHDTARDLFAEALPTVRDVGDRFETALLLSFIGELAWFDGDYARARDVLEEGLELARTMGAPFPQARCLLGLGRLAQVEGDTATAAALFDEAISAASRARFSHALVRCLHARADLDRDEGNVEECRAVLERALETATATGDKLGIAHSRRRLAYLDYLAGDYVRATSASLEAIAGHADADNVGGVAEVLEDLAAVALAQERGPHAARLLGAADGLRQARHAVRSPIDVPRHEQLVRRVRAALKTPAFKEAWAEGASLPLADAVNLAARSRGGRRRPTEGWAALTRSEHQVLELVAEGLSNPEIAERMFISPRTVQGHLSRVFSKLGVGSRRELRELARSQLESR